MNAFLSMENNEITFNELPVAVAVLIDKITSLELMIEESLSGNKMDDAQWMNVDELCEYLPGKPAKQTVYGWVCSKFIPYHKKGKKLQFLKAEIDEWLLADDKPKGSLQLPEVRRYNRRKRS